jgi:hypothetical protein
VNIEDVEVVPFHDRTELVCWACNGTITEYDGMDPVPLAQIVEDVIAELGHDHPRARA